MQHPAPIPSHVPPFMRHFWFSLPLLVMSALASASASAPAPAPSMQNPAPVMQETGAAGILIADAGGKDGKGRSAANTHKAGYPKKQKQPGNTPEEIRAWQAQRKWQGSGAWPGNAHWKGARAKDWKTERRSWPERGGYRGRMIGHTEFQKHFGEARPFRLWRQPKMSNGYPHFTHKGNTFRIVDPYPENWSTSWFRGNPVHVTYDNGYYLHNRKRPGFPIALMVVQ